MKQPSQTAIITAFIILLVICLIDIGSTVYLLKNSMMTEFNPLMGYALNNGGIAGLVFSKMTLTIVPLGVLLCLRKQHPAIVYKTLCVTGILYLIIYTLAFIFANS